MHDPEIFEARRAAYLQALGEDAVAVVSSLPERLRNGDAFHRFRQHSDLYYLTGFAEPGVVLVLRPGDPHEEMVMFVRPRDAEAERWDGVRAGVEGAIALGASQAYPTAELDTRLWPLLANREELHYSLGLDDEMDLRIGAALAKLRKTEKKGKRPPRAVVDPRAALHELRLHKAPDELARLRRAAAITAAAHRIAMAAGRPGVYEYELEARIDYEFRRHGGIPGYTSIVGAGANATVLHYIDNRCAIADGDLVLVDAGCEYDYYTADITRTFPASGRFAGAGRDLYALVLDVQKSAIALAAPGATLEDIHGHCVRRLTVGMVELGLLRGDPGELIATEAYKTYFPHHTSHWLGMDVHDVGAYTRGGAPRLLAPGMVITIEPGLYIPSDAADAPAALRGLGVRLEDDVLITPDGCEVLTAAAPKEVADVEAACRG